MSMATLKSFIAAMDDVKDVYLLHDGQHLTIEVVSVLNRARLALLMQNVPAVSYMRVNVPYSVTKAQFNAALTAGRASALDPMKLLRGVAAELSEYPDIRIRSALSSMWTEPLSLGEPFGVETLDLSQRMGVYLADRKTRRNLSEAWAVNIDGKAINGNYVVASEGHILCARYNGPRIDASPAQVSPALQELFAKRGVDLWTYETAKAYTRNEMEGTVTATGTVDSALFLYEETVIDTPPNFNTVILNQMDSANLIRVPGEAFWGAVDDAPQIGSMENSPLICICVLPGDGPRRRCIILVLHGGVTLSITETDVESADWMDAEVCYAHTVGSYFLHKIEKTRAYLGELRSYDITVGDTGSPQHVPGLPFDMWTLSSPFTLTHRLDGVVAECILVMGRKEAGTLGPALMTAIG